MLTRKQIEKALPEGYGIDKADGVWYFNGEDTYEWYTTCSDFCSLNQGTLEQWLSAFAWCRSTKGKDGYQVWR